MTIFRVDSIKSSISVACQFFVRENVARFINRYNSITHNYEREGAFNLWFTLLTPSVDVEQKILGEIAALDGVENMMRLRSNKRYKVKVQFKL